MDFEDISDGEEDPNTASEGKEDVASEEELEDIQEEEQEAEFQEEDQEDVIEEEQDDDPQDMEMPNMEWNEDGAIWELDDLQEDFEVWEPEEEEVQGEEFVEWKFDPEEAPAVESSDDEGFYVCHKV
ncbi:hypothetical protein RIF29_16552 [Crotalaria pallida]|uniref:Uncharacterized protein n=1 Tax=Crotalaria pallida TaxID=3830 RepID=A0AAN9FGT0_CROPI